MFLKKAGWKKLETFEAGDELNQNWELDGSTTKF